MEILSPEKLTRENKLNQEKNVNKQIVERLNFLEKNDSEDDTGFYKARSKQVGEVISSQIKEIKGINFEKAINQYLGYDLVERLLSQMPEAQDLVKKIDGRNNEALKKIIKHSDKYEIKLLDKNAEHEKEIQETFASLAEPLKIQEEIVNALQELLVKDDEFGSEYIQRLNKETEKLDRIIDETNLIFIKKAQELLTILPLSEKYQQELEELEKTLVASSKEDAAEILEIDWEILPAGSGPYENFQSGSGNGYIPHKINQARVDFIKSLGPDKIYRSKQADEKRAYEVYEFDTCVVICSPWSNHAVYVVPKEDWQSMSKIGKDKVRENGGIRFISILSLYLGGLILKKNYVQPTTNPE